MAAASHINRRTSRASRILVAIVAVSAASALLSAGPVSAAPGGNGTPLPPGVHEHHGPNGEIDVNVCPDQAQVGAATCFANERVDGTAKTLKPSRNEKAAPNTFVGNDGAYSPLYLQSAYNAPAGNPGATVAIVDAFDDSRAESDLAYYRSYFGLPPCTTDNGCFRKVDQRGGTDYPAGDQLWGLEISLDLDMVSAICPSCHILLVEADDNYTPNLGAAVNTAVALGASVVSNSWGGPEYENETTDDKLYFNHPGVPVVVSSGDSGYGPQFPAALSSVIAVGGTSLYQATADGTRNATETAWIGAGSGCSAYAPKPSWQHDTACSTRTIADVSAVSDPHTGVWVWDTYPLGGGWGILGGTSVAAPIVAAMYGLAGNPASTTQMPSTLYGDAADLNDIVSGSNGTCAVSYLCAALPGFDGPTGLGTPNGIRPFQRSSAAQSAPTAPTLSAVPGNSIDLSWTASTSSVGIAKYLVLRDGTQIGESISTTYVDETDVPGTTYTYQVVAVDTAGNRSAPSNAVTVTAPPHDTTPPSAPSSLTAKALSSTQVALYWSGAKDNVAVVGYDVYRNGVLVTSTTKPYFEDSGLTPGAKYTYSIKSRDAAGNVSLTAKTASVSVASASTTGSIAGFATGSTTGLPLANVKVSATLNGKTTSQSTNSSGFYALTRLVPGTYSVTVSASGYATQTFTVTVAANLATMQDLTVSAP